MMRRLILSVGCLALAVSTGCAMCSSPFDYDYGAYGGRWDRIERKPIPIGQPASSYQGKEYSAIVYGRGPLFIDALAQKLGQATFDQFLRDYYQSHQWGIGTTASFKQLAEKHCLCDLTPLFDEWVTP